MADGVLTYNPKNLLVIFGAEQLHGFSEDDVITIAPNGDGTQIYVGADGEVGRSIDPNQTYEITITLEDILDDIKQALDQI